MGEPTYRASVSYLLKIEHERKQKELQNLRDEAESIRQSTGSSKNIPPALFDRMDKIVWRLNDIRKLLEY